MPVFRGGLGGEDTVTVHTVQEGGAAAIREFPAR